MNESFNQQSLIRWKKWLSILAISCTPIPSLLFIKEKQKQKLLTQVPLIFRQRTTQNDALCSLMSAVLLRSVRPTLFSGTSLSIRMHPLNVKEKENYIVCHEDNIGESVTFTLTLKNVPNSLIILKWHFPKCYKKESNSNTKFPFMIHHPMMLCIEETNNHTNKQISSLIHKCRQNNWICIQMKIKTIVYPNMHNPNIKRDSYSNVPIVSVCSNSIRMTIQNIHQRIHQNKTCPLFLIGTSSFSNDLIIQYLGEEGLSNSLPLFVKGASIIENDSIPILNHQHYFHHISIPLLLLINSDIHYTQESIQKQSVYHTNPNIIVVNVKMGKDWNWNASRKYGLCEIYSFLLLQLYKNSKYTNNPKFQIKADWAGRVICQFIRAILFFLQNNVNVSNLIASKL